MSKIELDNITSGYNLGKINANFEKLETELNDKVLYRDNTSLEANQMEQPLDMNNQRILNLPPPVDPTDALRLQDLIDAGIDGVTPVVQPRQTADGATATFAVPAGTTSANALFVYVNGVYQSAAVYTFVVSTSSITFVEVPELNDVVEVTQFSPAFIDDWIVRSDLPSDMEPVLEADLSQSYTFKTVALMQASLIVFPVGKKIFWQGYHTESDGGSNWGIVTAGAHTDDGGSVLTLADGQYVAANLKGDINIRKFGAKGDAATDDQPSIQAAIDFSRSTKVPDGLFLVNTELVLSDQGSISGLGGYAISRLIGSASGNNCLRITPTSGSFTKHQVVSGITFQSQQATSLGAIGVTGSGIYTYGAKIKNCFFDASLTKGLYGNFINLASTTNVWGYYGSPLNMTSAVDLVGSFNTEANQNVFYGDIMSNLTGDAIKVVDGWNTQLTNVTIDNIGGHAINTEGGFSLGITGCWFERCAAGAILKSTSGSSGNFIISVNNSLMQVTTAGALNTRVFDEAGSVKVHVTDTAFGGLNDGDVIANGGIALCNNHTKMNFGAENYIPGGFIRADLTGYTWDTPSIVVDDIAAYNKSFNETDGTTANIAKTIRNSNASFASTLLELKSARAASGAYKFLELISDYDGTPSVEHQFLGSGQAYHHRGVSGGSWTTATRPVPSQAGTMIWDSTISKPIWWNGAAWEDATGAAV